MNTEPASQEPTSSEQASPEPTSSEPASSEPASSEPASSTTNPEAENTEVAKWLRDNRVPTELIDKFYKAGFYNIEDLDENALDKVIPEQYHGHKKRLANKLKKHPKSPEMMAKPDLPPGKSFDLSLPTLETHTETIELPSIDKVSSLGEKLTTPADLKQMDWILIAKNTNVLHGYTFTSKGIDFAPRKVLEWQIPESGEEFWISEIGSATVTSEAVYGEKQQSFVKQGFINASADFESPFCSVAAEYTSSKNDLSVLNGKQVHIVGIWDYPRVRLFLDKCTAVSCNFKEAIKEAVSIPNDYRKRKALDDVFSDFGHYVAVDINLGGHLISTHKETITQSRTEEKIEQEVKAALNVKIGKYGGGAKLDLGSASQDVKDAYNRSETLSFESIGGDTLLTNNPAEWAASIGIPKFWAVTNKNKLIQTTDLLDRNLRALVLEVYGIASWMTYLDEYLELYGPTPIKLIERDTGIKGLKDLAEKYNEELKSSSETSSSSSSSIPKYDISATTYKFSNDERDRDNVIKFKNQDWSFLEGDFKNIVEGFEIIGKWFHSLKKEGTPSRIKEGTPSRIKKGTSSAYRSHG
jgi:hypothetical protein